MFTKFKPGDKIINQRGHVWVVLNTSDDYMSGIILCHDNHKLIGLQDRVLIHSHHSWFPLLGEITVPTSTQIKVGDIVRSGENPGVRMIVTFINLVNHPMAICVDLKNGNICNSPLDKLIITADRTISGGE